MLQFKDITIENEKLIVKGDEYHFNKMLQIEARRLTLKDQAIRIISFSLLFSAIGWIFITPYLGLFLFSVGLVLSIFTAKPYELRGEFKGVDETGNHWSPILRSRKLEEFSIFQKVAKDVSVRINS